MVPLTLPAHTSILTGQYPDEHGVRTNDGFRASPDLTTLAEWLPDHSSAAFVSAAVLDRAFGLDQGFDHYEDDVDAPDQPLAVPRTHAEDTADRATAWLASQTGPVLMWAHFYDAHLPLEPPSDLAERYPDPYDAEIARADRALGQLLDTFRVMGRDPLVIVVGDHGEGRGDHGEETHGVFVYRSTMRVPLVIAGPGVEPGRIGVPVSQVDLVPTVLEALGMPAPDVSGRSLWPAARGQSMPAVPIYGESLYGQLSFGLAPLRAMQDDEHRYIQAPTPERFAWRTDPSSAENLGPDAAMASWIQARGVGHAARAGLSAGLQDQLAALGYLGGVNELDDGADLPDPKDHAELPSLLHQLIVTARTSEPHVAIPMLVAFRERYPGVTAVHSLLSTAYELEGDRAAALSALEPLLSSAPADPGLRTRRAVLLDEPERTQALVQVVADDPGWSDARALLAWDAWTRGDVATAETHARHGLERDPDVLSLVLLRGAVLTHTGRGKAAEPDLVRVYAEAPEDPLVRVFLGRALGQQGRSDEALAVLAEQERLLPGDPAVAELIGLIAYNAGRFDEARVALVRSAEDPDASHEVALALADLESMAGRHDEAAAWVRVARSKAPDAAEIDRVEASVLLRAGQIDEAAGRLR